MTAMLAAAIRRAMDEADLDRRLVVTPLLDPEAQIGAGSVDLRLGTEFLETQRGGQPVVDPLHDEVGNTSAARRRHDRTYVPLGHSFILHPGQFVLGSTLEFIGLPDYVSGQVLSRSSWGRLGLLVATAVAVMPGYRGVLTLELVNSGNVPIQLTPGLRVAQLQLWASDEESGRSYSVGEGKYQSPLGPEDNKLVVEKPELETLLRISQTMHRGTVPPT